MTRGGKATCVDKTVLPDAQPWLILGDTKCKIAITNLYYLIAN